MKTGIRKILITAFLTVISVCCFALCGCDMPTEGTKHTIKITGAYDFEVEFSVELKEKQTFSSKDEVAETITSISRGAVESTDIADSVIVKDSAIYKIVIKDLTENDNLKELFRTIEDNYLKKFTSWKNFPDSPVKYTTKDGTDVLVYVSTEFAEEYEIDIYVFFFEQGTVDALADDMGGGHGGNGEETTIQIQWAYNFTGNCELIEKRRFSSREEMANAIGISVADNDRILNMMAPEESAMYRIRIKDAADKDDVEAYFRLIAEEYLAKFNGWNGSEEETLKYKMQDGKELAVFISAENIREYELDIYVLFFEEGTIAYLTGNGGDGGEGGGTHGGGGEENSTIQINGAYDFTGNCELIGSKLFGNATEAADIISTISKGKVKSDAVIDKVVDGGGEYKIRIKGIPSGVKLEEYIHKVANEYLAKYSSWKTFPDSPVKYTTQNGKDVLIYVSTEYARESTIYICVFFFNAGAVDALAQGTSGGGTVGGDGGEGGGTHGGGDDETQTVSVGIMFDNGNVSYQTFTKGSVVYFAQLYPDYDVYTDASFSHVLGIDEGVTIVEGLTIFVRTKQQTPSEVSVTIYDIDTDGNKTIYMTEHPRYNSTFKFVYYGFVLYWDEEFTQEIDPNQEFTLTKDVEVYRRDYYDRVPVFFNVHYYTNGVEENIGAQDVFFRGELLSIDKNFISRDFGYEFYYDKGKTQKVFEGDNVLIVRETDDKKNVYGFRDDRRQAVLTFMLDGNELCKTLIGVGDTIGDDHYLYLGTKTYRIKDCDIPKDQPIRENKTINITAEVTNNYAVTVHLCYEGDVKRTFVNYFPIGGEDWEITADDGYYTDASCTQPFVETVNSTTTLYQKIGVNFDRYVGN